MHLVLFRNSSRYISIKFKEKAQACPHYHQSHQSLLALLLFNCSVVSGSLQSHELKHARPPCPSPTPRVCSNSCPLSWCHYPTISSSIAPFSCLQSFPASGSSPMNMPKYWNFSVSISSSNEYSGLISFRIDWFNLLAVQGTLKSLLQYYSSKVPILGIQPSLWSNSHICT